MRSNAKFKHTNFLKRDRYQAKLNAGKVCGKTHKFFLGVHYSAHPFFVSAFLKMFK